MITITITDREHNYIRVKSNHPAFKEAYGNGITGLKKDTFRIMHNLTTWANNEVKEAILFEVE